ncbi:autotransporter outer membrane beta-barrel domain-containing protein [Serratia sp. DD3]|uniref:autotransporter outer membrane beta-barrel domain-containing protein n=1 Tax=Serratia sp. DD3 TaxID=1410619 RepID=UPI001F1E495E|nr:autotransporter outer membrane beta-barrel domain-containing protein [Serratia sp. DD3]
MAGAGLLAISGGNLTVTDGGLFSGVVSGSTGSLTAATGSLVLTGTNSYSGVTAVESGAILQIGNGGLTGSYSGDINNAGLVVFDRSNAASYAGVISGNGSLTQSGSGTLALTGVNSYSGGTTVANGTLRLTGSGAINASSAVDIAAGATFAIDQTSANGGNYSFANPLTGTGVLSVALQNGSNSFDFTDTAGSDFTGTLTLGTSNFDLSGTNTAALSQATLELGTGNITTVGIGEQVIGGLQFNGGELKFDAIVPAQQQANGMVTVANLNLTGIGRIAIDLPPAPGVINPPVLDNTNILSQDDGGAYTQLIALTARGTLNGQGGALTLVDQSGNALSNSQSVSIAEGGNTVAVGTYDYRLNTGVLNNGLYVAYALKQVDLLFGQILTLTPDATATGPALNLSAQITGTGSLAITGVVGQVVTLANALNNYSGSTTVNSGTLQLGSNNALGATSQLDIATGAATNINGFTQTIASLTGSGLLAVNGGALTVAQGGLFSGVIAGTTGTLTASSGTLILTGANSYSGTTTVGSGATLQIGNGGIDGSYVGNISNAGLVVFDRTDAASYAGVISGNGNLTQNGSGTLTLTGVNSYTGGTTVADGTLRLTGAGAINASSAVNIAAGATFAIDQTTGNGGNAIFANPLTGAGLLSVALQNSSNTFNFTGSAGSAFSGTLALGSSSFNLSGSNTSALSLATLEIGTGNATTVGLGNQAIGNLTMNGGALRFANLPSGQVTTGALVLDAGSVQLDPTVVADNAGNLLQQDEGVLERLVSASSVTGSASNLTLTNLTGGNLTTSAVNIFQGGNIVAIGDYGYALVANATGLFVNVGLTQLALQTGQTLTFSGDSTTPPGADDMSALITGAGNLAIAATSVITLNNSSNDYTGSTTVTSGTLQLGSDNALGSTRQLAINTGAVTDIHGFTQSVGSLIGTGTLNINGGALTVDNGGFFAGIVAGSDGLLTVSNGTLFFTGTNTYIGETQVNSGAYLQIGIGGTAGSYAANPANGSALDILNDGTVVFDRSDALSYDGIIGGSGRLVQDGSGTLTLTGANSYTGGTTVAQGTLRLTDSGAISSSGTVAIAAGATFAIDQTTANGGDYVLANPLTGAGVLSVALQNGSNTFDFASPTGSAFTGTLALVRSTFDLSGSNTTALTQATLVAGVGSDIVVGDGYQTIANLTFAGGKVDFDAQPPATNQANTVIETTGTLDVSGTGTAQVAVPPSFSVEPPTVDTSLSILEQDDQNLLVKLIQANGEVKGRAGNMTLIDQDGNVITNETIIGLTNTDTGPIVAEGHYDYRLTASHEITGLYINYGLFELDLMGTGANALVLAPRAGATGDAADLTSYITGSGDLAIAAVPGDKVSLSNISNDYTGATLVRSGTLRLMADGVLGQTSDLALSANAQVDINGYQQTVGKLNTAVGSKLDLQGGTLIVRNGGLNDGELTGSGALQLDGGTLVVTGHNSSMSAMTTIAATATAQLAQTDALGTGGIDNRGTLDFNGAQGILSNVLQGAGVMLFSGGANVALSVDNNAFTGIFRTESGTRLSTSQPGQLGTASIDNNGTLLLDVTQNWLLTHSVTGNGTLVKQGNGRLQIAGNNVQVNLTRVEAGLLLLDSSIQSRASSAAATPVQLNSSVQILQAGSLGASGVINGSLENEGRVLIGQAATGGSFANLTVNGNYTGNNGALLFNTTLARDNAATDRLTINGSTSGQSKVIVNQVGGSGEQTQQGILLIQVNGQSAGQFTLENRLVAGAFDYNLYQGTPANPGEGSWYLRSTGPDNNTPVYRPEAGSYLANQVAAQNLFAMRHEDRGQRVAGSNMWLRQVGGHSTFDDTSGQIDNRTSRFVTQIGGDIYETEHLVAGVMFAYGTAHSNSRSNQTDYTSYADIDGTSLGVYGTWYQNGRNADGLYIDGSLQYAWLQGSVQGQQLQKEDYRMSGVIASVETGWRLPLAHYAHGKLYLEPQLQLTWNDISGGSHQEQNGTQVDLNNQSTLQARIGAKLGYDIAIKDSDQPLTLYGAINLPYQNKLTHVRMDDSTLEQQGGRRSGVELKLGAEGNINKNFSTWGSVSQLFGQHSVTDTTVMMGVKYTF